MTQQSDLLTIGGLALFGIGIAWVLPNLRLYPTAVTPAPTAAAAPKPVATGGLTPAVLGLKATGKKVAMQKGANHRNGQRFNVNHKFKNYVMIGYFKTGNGQEVIEMKTDGPNHGGCTSLPTCAWLEPDLKIADGSAHLGAEFPHPKNHNDRPCPSCKSIGSIANKEIGFAVGAWQTGQFRTVAMWANQTPSTTGWKKLLQETDKGQITTPQIAARDPGGALMSKYENGMEAEIRMHNAKSGDTSMRDCNVWEILPPAATAAYAGVRWYK